jgi:hypothetical protein
MAGTLEPFDEQLVPPWHAPPQRSAPPGYRSREVVLRGVKGGVKFVTVSEIA